MKKKLFLISIILILSCLTFGNAYQQIPQAAVTPTASSQSSVYSGPDQTMNGSGLWDFGGSIGLRHQGEPSATGMWTTSGGTGEEWVLYELNTSYEIGWIQIWNHGQDAALDRGLMNVRIEYSDDTDPNIWVPLMNGAEDLFTLTQAPGPEGWHIHTNGTKWFAPTDVIDFGGVNARRIRITSLSVAEGGTYGGTYRGLAEVRIFGAPPSMTPTFKTYDINPAWQRLYGATATASSYFNNNPDVSPAKTIDNSGMWNFGGDIGERHQNVSWGGWMWLTSNSTTEEWIQYEFQEIMDLQLLEIWNFLQIDTAPGRSMRNITIESSVDGLTWDWLGDYTLWPVPPLNDPNWHYHASGGTYWIRPTDYIDCGGITAKYLRITGWAPAEGGTYGENLRGLAEVRFYVTIPEPDPSWPLELWIPNDNVTATASSTVGQEGWGADLAANGSGMNTWLLHNNEFSGVGMWISALGGGAAQNPSPGDFAGPAWIRFDFDDEYPLGWMWIWNNNQPTASHRGLQDVHVEFTQDGTNWSHLGKFTIPKGAGLDNMEYSLAVDFGGLSAQSVLITADPNNSSYGTDGYYSLSEVRFGIYGTRVPDTDQDKDVDVDDIRDVAYNWVGDYAGCPEPPTGDFNGDCEVNMMDMAILGRFYLIE